MTKHEEKQMFAQFVHSIPANTYLRSIMGEISCEVGQAIDNDFEFISLTRHFRQQCEQKAELSRLQAKRDQLAAEVRDLETKRAKAVVALDSIKSDARILAGMV